MIIKYREDNLTIKTEDENEILVVVFLPKNISFALRQKASTRYLTKCYGEISTDFLTTGNVVFTPTSGEDFEKLDKYKDVIYKVCKLHYSCFR